MDSIFQPESIRQILGSEILEAEGSNTTSLTFCHGEYEFDRKIHKRLIPPKAHELEKIPPLMLPGPAMNPSPNIGVNGNSIFEEPRLSESSSGLSSIFPNFIRDDDSMLAVGEADPIASAITSVSDKRLHSDSALANNFLAPMEKEISPEKQQDILELFCSDFNVRIPNSSFGIYGLERHQDFAAGLEEMPDFPYHHDSNGSSSNLNDLGDPVIPPDSSEISFRSSQFNFSENSAAPSQENSFSASSSTSSNTTSTPSPSTAATTPMITPSSPDGRFCSYCHSKFTRQSDLKRHEGRHFPERWEFHCKQPGCDRKGRKGFYRRDKLMAHLRQAHGMDT